MPDNASGGQIYSMPSANVARRPNPGNLRAIRDRRGRSQVDEDLEAFGMRMYGITNGLIDEDTAWDDPEGRRLFQKYLGQDIPPPQVRELRTQVEIPEGMGVGYPPDVDAISGEVAQQASLLNPEAINAGYAGFAPQDLGAPPQMGDAAAFSQPGRENPMASLDALLSAPAQGYTREDVQTIPGRKFMPRTTEQLARYVREELFQGRDVPAELMAASKVDPSALKGIRDLEIVDRKNKSREAIAARKQAGEDRRKQMDIDARADRLATVMANREDSLEKRLTAMREMRKMTIDAASAKTKALIEQSNRRLYMNMITKLDDTLGADLAQQVADGLVNKGLTIDQLPMAEAVKQRIAEEMKGRSELRSARTANLQQAQVYRAKGYELQEARYLTTIDKANAELQMRVASSTAERTRFMEIQKQLNALALAEKTNPASRAMVNRAVIEILGELNIEESTPEGVEYYKSWLGSLIGQDWGKKPLTLVEKGKGAGTAPPISNPVIAPKLGGEIKSRLPGKKSETPPTAEGFLNKYKVPK